MISNMSRPYNSFDEVKNLTETQLNSLLKKGDVPEQVWAIWSLAIKKGKDSIPEIKGIFDNEPSLGVRRNLVIVLASMKQTDLLYNLAEIDPNAFVRADALQYLIRIRNDKKLGEFLRKTLIKDSEHIVKIRIIRESPSNLLNLSFDSLMEFITLKNPELQIACLEYLEKSILIDDEKAKSLSKLLLEEKNKNILGKIVSIIFDAKKNELILEAGLKQNDKTNFDLLSYLINRQVKFPWKTLKKYINHRHRQDTYMIADFIQDPKDPKAFEWIVHKYAQILETQPWEYEIGKIHDLFLEIFPIIEKPDQISDRFISDLETIYKYIKMTSSDLQIEIKKGWENGFHDKDYYEKTISDEKYIINTLEGWLR